MSEKHMGHADRGEWSVRVPAWGWPTLVLVLFPLLTILHEFFHDARRLLGVPGH